VLRLCRTLGRFNEEHQALQRPCHMMSAFEQTYLPSNDRFGSFATGSGEQQVRYASKAEVYLELGGSAAGLCGRDVLDVKSSQQPVEGGAVPFQKT
jgi:hypothetical protein